MELTKEDFLAYVPFSRNISEADLKPYVQDALLMDVRPLLGALYGKIMGAEALTSQEEAIRVLVRPVWVFHAYVRFLPFHGLSITPAGITKAKDNEGTYEQVSAQERSQIIASFRSKINYWESELGKALKELNGTGRPSGKRSRIGLRVVGSRLKNRGCGGC